MRPAAPDNATGFPPPIIYGACRRPIAVVPRPPRRRLTAVAGLTPPQEHSQKCMRKMDKDDI